MGFLGDLLGDILDGDGSQSFGQRIRSDNQALQDLYKLTYFDFGLTPLRNLKENQLVPMKAGTTFGNKIYSFEIRGNILHPNTFLSSGYGSPFHEINRELAPPKGRVWAYDITRLGESILVGTSAYPGDEAYAQSEEYLKILRLIGDVIMPTLSRVPSIHLTFDTIWNQFRIPDSISITVSTLSPLSDHHLQNIVNRVLHSYKRSDAPPVTADYSINAMEGTVTLVMREASSVPPQAPAASLNNSEGLADFITNLNAFVENPEKFAGPADDGFPYEFYRGLGLIDDEDMVLVPSMLGPMRVHMTNDSAKETLLAYQPEK